MNRDCALCHHYESDHDPFSRGCVGIDHTTGAVCDCPCFEPEPCGCGGSHDCPDCQDRPALAGRSCCVDEETK